jgi:uncharacterized iron-regulated protein
MEERVKRIGLLGIAAALLVGCGQRLASAPLRASAVASGVGSASVPAGLLASFGAAGEPLSWPGAVARLAGADVTYLGEFHDDPASHRLEVAVLEELAAKSDLALSLEMFETDVQGLLDAYLAGTVSEAEFLAGSRPWPNYRTDYRPLVEFAKARGIPVVASNVPRRLASLVAKGGLAALGNLPDSEKRWAHIPASCPADAYWEEFRNVSSHPGMPPDAVWKWYEAQCLKDETMARSIALAMGRRRVLHVNGAFHSDKALGTPMRVGLWRPGASSVVATVRPVPAAPPALPPDMSGVADVTCFVTGPARGRPLPDRI